MSERPQLQKDDAAEPERLRKVLNGILLGFAQRLEALEKAGSLVELEDVVVEVGATYASGTTPFDGTLRVSCPFTPRGVTVLRCERTMPAGQPVLTSAVGVDWKFLGGPSAGDGALVINHVTGLAVNSRYSLRLGVLRG